MKEKSSSLNHQVYFSDSDIDYDELISICSQETIEANYPLSDSISNNVVIYDAKDFRSFVGNIEEEIKLKTEMHHVLESGPGVFVVRNLYNEDVIDESNAIFEKIVKNESNSSNDHFAAGTNTRIWNSFQKVAMENQEAFINYY